MRVALISGDPAYLFRFRGPIARALRERGHEVVAIAGRPDAEVERAFAGLGVRYRSFALDRGGTNPLGELGTLAALIRVLREERPDVTLANTLKMIAYVGIAARAAGVPRSVSFVTGLGPAFAEREGARALLVHHAARLLLRAGLSHNDAFVFQNPDDEATLRSFGLLREGARVVRVAGSGIDPDEYPGSIAPVDPVRFLFLGRLLRQKGIEDFLEAARRVRARRDDVAFHVVGGLDASHGPAVTAETMARASEALGLVYHGPLADVRPALREASVLVVPSRTGEGMPRTILEGFSTGRAAITTDVSGCRHAVSEGETGFVVPPADPVALAEAMMRFVERPVLVRELGAAARRAAETRFHVAGVVGTILEVLGA